jgi:hypothetical protein
VLTCGWSRPNRIAILELRARVPPDSRGHGGGREKVIWANQFDNLANRDGRRTMTGPEIWDQTSGEVDAFTCACGTGGTLAGVALALKAKNPRVRIVLANPEGSALYGWVKNKDLTVQDSSITEGIDQSRVPENLAGAPIDDAEALEQVYDLLIMKACRSALPPGSTLRLPSGWRGRWSAGFPWRRAMVVSTALSSMNTSRSGAIPPIPAASSVCQVARACATSARSCSAARMLRFFHVQSSRRSVRPIVQGFTRTPVSSARRSRHSANVR